MSVKLISVSALAKRIGLSKVLMTRPLATKMFEISIEEYGAPLAGDICICDMAGIDDCSGSFVDEFVHRWCYLVKEKDNALFVLRNLSDDVLYTVDSALSHRNRLSDDSLVILRYGSNGYHLVGDRVENNVREVFDMLATGEHVTVRMVADRFAVGLNSAGNRLKKIYDAHLAIRNEQSAENGGKFEYYLPDIK